MPIKQLASLISALPKKPGELKISTREGTMSDSIIGNRTTIPSGEHKLKSIVGIDDTLLIASTDNL